MTVQEIKHEFFSRRNGIIADAYRNAGDPHKTVFGLQLPQLSEIARMAGMPDTALSVQLWADRDCRESRLLACWLVDHADVTEQQALDMAADTRTREEADILAFRLLRRLPFATALADKIRKSSASDISIYVATALKRNLQP